MKQSVCLARTLDLPTAGIDLAAFIEQNRLAFVLDSSQTDPLCGRFSFIGCDPFALVSGTSLSEFNQLKDRYSRFSCQGMEETPFSCGAVGFLGYDVGCAWQAIADRKPKIEGLPDFWFGFYDVVATLDHARKKIVITSSGFPEAEPVRREARAVERLHWMTGRIQERFNISKSVTAIWDKARIEPSMTEAAYKEAIDRILRYIRDGDIYLMNLSQQMRVETGRSDLAQLTALYTRLRRLSPTSFGAFLNAGQIQILSTSPERFLKLENGEIEIRPMKGTRPRGRTPEEDARLKEELLNSPKEKAELLMVTDLERNDLGRVCEYGSVEVASLRNLEEYATVFQTTSLIRGRLKPSSTVFEAIEACFPSGSVTGCPKIRAMQIINELETTRRGFYTGALGYLGFNGNADLNILIRSILAVDTALYFHVGGGIVADSDPQQEYEEIWHKAKAIVAALQSHDQDQTLYRR